ncbi:hypothetical protein HN371_08630 [Candidatus Poribacteria bacterium]|jgi:hypothetical protein|nr:hypothetical protein [Candidatus Poribacteria bacterium]MBT7098057.1 hypothetical protein [Candidatus Poribacteria bacterium]
MSGDERHGPGGTMEFDIGEFFGDGGKIYELDNTPAGATRIQDINPVRITYARALATITPDDCCVVVEGDDGLLYLLRVGEVSWSWGEIETGRFTVTPIKGDDDNL